MFLLLLLLLLLLFAVLEFEPRASCKLGKCITLSKISILTIAFN
jgi:hypothetical protein